MQPEIKKLITTKEDYIEIMHEIDLLLTSLYKTNDVSFEDILKKETRHKTFEILSQMLSKEVDKRIFLESIKKELALVQEVKVTLPIDPSKSIIEAIYSFFAENVLKYSFYLDVFVDPSIVAGCTVVHDGKIFDLSYKNKITEAISQKHI